MNFYPRPPRGGRPSNRPSAPRPTNFYPRPPRGGRRGAGCSNCAGPQFLSTPSARRATRLKRDRCGISPISIHALREEGDATTCGPPRRGRYFYPRPPRGGRLACAGVFVYLVQFLSTPSARRATFHLSGKRCVFWDFYPRPPRGGRLAALPCGKDPRNFYPRPPRGGRLLQHRHSVTVQQISIHALREEGDSKAYADYALRSKFLSTPSARRATMLRMYSVNCFSISIHALREEGDMPRGTTPAPPTNFYPRPPRGGRHTALSPPASPMIFLSTPSARRATECFKRRIKPNVFLSTPSARRATVFRCPQRAP